MKNLNFTPLDASKKANNNLGDAMVLLNCDQDHILCVPFESFLA